MTNEEAIMNASLDIKMIRDIINSMSDKNGQISQEQQMSYRNNLKQDKWGNSVFTQKKKKIGEEDYNEENDEGDIFDHSSSSSSEVDDKSNSESEVSASLNESKGTH